VEPEPSQAAGGLGHECAVPAHLPAARRRGMLTGMANPLARIVALITPKRRWAQFSLKSLLVMVCRDKPQTAVVGGDRHDRLQHRAARAVVTAP
jgi:hypothetical protein